MRFLTLYNAINVYIFYSLHRFRQREYIYARCGRFSTALISWRTNLSPFTKDCRVLRAFNVTLSIFERFIPLTINKKGYNVNRLISHLSELLFSDFSAIWCIFRFGISCMKYHLLLKVICFIVLSWEQRTHAGSRNQKFCCGLQHRCIHRSHRRQSAVTCSADREPPSWSWPSASQVS